MYPAVHATRESRMGMPASMTARDVALMQAARTPPGGVGFVKEWASGGRVLMGGLPPKTLP